MNHWLLKSEPNCWSWQQQLDAKAPEQWDGVRNYQARNLMRDMRKNDLCFFYHSQTEKQIVGVVEVANEAHPDSTDTTGKWECVDVQAVASFPKPVTLQTIKAHPDLANMVLVKNSRLSVQPVRKAEWDIICALGEYNP